MTIAETAPALLDSATSIPGLAGHTILDFWQWAYSDLLSNRNRALFAEFIVGTALGVLGQPRVEWDSVDLHYSGHASK